MTHWVWQTFSDYGIPLSETLAELPTPQGTEVLVRVGHCGVCHSDVHLHDGYFDLGGGRKAELAGGRPLPFALGHEIEGSVEAVGPEASGVNSGQPYVIYPWIGWGQCALCLRGDEHLCAKPRQIGIQVDGGYASHVMVPHPRYLLDYGSIAPEHAGPYMCSGVTAYSAVKKLGRTVEDGPVLIVGHSNTVPGIVAALGGARPAPVSHPDFGDLWRGEPRGGYRRTVRLHRMEFLSRACACR